MNSKSKTLTTIILFGVLILFGALGAVSATEDPDTSCPFTSQDGRTIVTFDEQIRSDKTLADATTTEISVSLTPGSYDVSLYAFDGPKSRGTQPDESYKIIFLDSSGATVAESGATSDLADNVNFAEVNELVSTNLDIPSGVVKVAGLHDVYPDQSNANSLIAGCAAFDFNKESDDRDKKSSKGSRELLQFFCEPNWECSGWGDCFEGVMTRTCHDTNSCEVSYNKPVERADCKMPKVLVEEPNLSGLFIFLGILIFLILILFLIMLLRKKLR